MTKPSDKDHKVATDCVDWADPYDPDYAGIIEYVAQAIADTRDESYLQGLQHALKACECGKCACKISQLLASTCNTLHVEEKDSR